MVGLCASWSIVLRERKVGNAGGKENCWNIFEWWQKMDLMSGWIGRPYLGCRHFSHHNREESNRQILVGEEMCCGKLGKSSLISLSSWWKGSEVISERKYWGGVVRSFRGGWLTKYLSVRKCVRGCGEASMWGQWLSVEGETSQHAVFFSSHISPAE